MGLSASLVVLVGWTPFLAAGFARNLLIAGAAMTAGTLVGGGLGWARDGRSAAVRWAAALATGLCRNVPSFVLMFYVAFVLPVEIAGPEFLVAVPVWIKAALALTIPAIGFASDQYLALRQQRTAGLATAAETFATAWLQYFLIVLMASATASVIGADEVVGRANRVIATDSRVEFLVATYLYVAAWFLAAGLMVSAIAAGLARLRKLSRAQSSPQRLA